MKADLTRLIDDSVLEYIRTPDEEPQARRTGRRWAKPAFGLALCLAFAGTGLVAHTMVKNSNLQAEALFNASDADPSFTVQHVADVYVLDIKPGNGQIPMLTDTGTYHLETDDDGLLMAKTERVELYDEYETDWLKANTVSGISFLNGVDGAYADGYLLKEIWVGKDKDSDSETDFTVLEIPSEDGIADLGKITLTNNPGHPGLSDIEDGKYVAGDDGNYAICIQDGDVVRLVFEEIPGWESADVDVFDYDVTDGGYYLKEDLRGEKQDTSGFADEDGTVYLNTKGQGIHSPDNYAGDGAKLAFGSDSIRTGLADEALDDGLDTVNVYNFGQDLKGVARGLIKGVTDSGKIKWNEKLTVPDLFGNGKATGKTGYLDGTYMFTFRRDGSNKTLSAVESEYGTAAEDLEILDEAGEGFTNSFWILDGAPSYNTDGHDLPFGPGGFGDGHNAFFGFSYIEDFVLQPGYCGPFDFFGYSDDDLWVFAAQVDSDGNAMEDTLVQVLDLGGVHGGLVQYADLRDVIGKVEYGEEAQRWRLYVFGLERDGASSSCYLSYSLPGVKLDDTRTVSPVVVEAGRFGPNDGRVRTFVLEDGTYGKYNGTYSDGSETTITSGEVFAIPDGDFVDINGMDRGASFTVTETGAARVWNSKGSGYAVDDTAEAVAGTDEWLTFVSAEKPGMLTVGADAIGAPEGGHRVKLSVDSVGKIEISAIDESKGPVGSRVTDENGELVLALEAGEALTLYNLPEDSGFTLEPESAPGWSITNITAEGGEISGETVSGMFPAQAIYHYAEDGKAPAETKLEQSVGGDFSIVDILLGDGALISYRISVRNINDVPMGVKVHDRLPDGLEAMTSTLGGGTLDGREITWDLKLEPYGEEELAFTCRASGIPEDVFENTVRTVSGDGAESESNTVTAMIP